MTVRRTVYIHSSCQAGSLAIRKGEQQPALASAKRLRRKKRAAAMEEVMICFSLNEVKQPLNSHCAGFILHACQLEFD